MFRFVLVLPINVDRESKPVLEEPLVLIELLICVEPACLLFQEGGRLNYCSIVTPVSLAHERLTCGIVVSLVNVIWIVMVSATFDEPSACDGGLDRHKPLIGSDCGLVRAQCETAQRPVIRVVQRLNQIRVDRVAR